MAKTEPAVQAHVDRITSTILVARNQRVILDADLAALYGVTTKALNQAVKRNVARFPADFLFRLTRDEVQALNRSQSVTGSQKHRDPRLSPPNLRPKPKFEVDSAKARGVRLGRCLLSR